MNCTIPKHLNTSPHLLGVIPLFFKMLTKKQFRILEIFSQNIYHSYPFKQVIDAYGGKSKSLIPSYLKKLVNDSILLKEKISNVGIYRLNLDNPQIFSYLHALFWEKLPSPARLSVKEIIDASYAGFPFACIVVFGSYAEGTKKKDSDLDIALIIPDNSDRKAAEKVMDKAKMVSVLKLDIHIILQQEFADMLNADYENLGKEIARKNLPLTNIDAFYSIIRKGVKNGFNL